MDTAQWPQELGLVKPMEDLVSSTTNNSNNTRPQMMERRARPQKEQALNCPRCNSTNTKFCYYNNYSLTQPRYFCKTCRRYWTEGGSLRNVPVGGGSRKNKRSSSSSSSAITATTTITNTTPSSSSSQNPKFHEGQDLNLGFPHHNLPEFGDFPNIESSRNNNNSSSSNNNNTSSAMEFLRTGVSGRGLGPFMSMPMPMPMSMPEVRAIYPSGFGLHDFRPPTHSFPLQGVQESAGRLMFPFEDLKQVSSSIAEFDQNRGQGGDPPGFWNGMMGGGGSW